MSRDRKTGCIIALAVILAISLSTCRTIDRRAVVEKRLTELKPRGKKVETEWGVYSAGPGNFDKLIAEVEKEAKKLADMGDEFIPCLVDEFLELGETNVLAVPENLFLYEVLSEALKTIGKKTVPYLIEGLYSGRGRVGTARTLSYIGAKDELRKAYQELSGVKKLRAAAGLATAGEPDGILFILDTVHIKVDDGAPSPADFMQDDEAIQNHAALMAIGNVGKKGYNVLYDVLTGPEGKRLTSIRLLSRMPPTLEKGVSRLNPEKRSIKNSRITGFLMLREILEE